MPYWVTVTIDWAGKQQNQARSHDFDTRDQAIAELAKIKKAQEIWRSGSIHNTAPYEDSKKELPDWLVVHDVGHIVSATVEGSG